MGAAIATGGGTVGGMVERRGRVRVIAAMCVLLVAVTSGCTWRDIQVLASDAMDGRRAGTPGGAAARHYVAERLASFAQPIHPELTGDARYEQPFAQGTNVVGIIPGTELPDEYVLVGAHYDHLGHSCRTANSADTICNGATDNATGTAAAIRVAEEFAAHPGRRSVIVALFDAEEEGLLGSLAYVANPVVPLSKTVATVTFDILGANMLPAGRNSTFAVGGETGGPVMTDAVRAATDASPLEEARLSAVMGAYRSDYASFLGASVPSLFFSDSTGPCYHTAQDDLNVVDRTKLDVQIHTAMDVTRRLVDGVDRPTWAAAPLVTYDDLVLVSDLIDRSAADWGRFSATDQSTLATIQTEMHGWVAAGASGFTATVQNSFLTRANQTVSIFTHGTCDGFLSDPPTSIPTP